MAHQMEDVSPGCPSYVPGPIRVQNSVTLLTGMKSSCSHAKQRNHSSPILKSTSGPGSSKNKDGFPQSGYPH
ncbi:hypothetical protein AOLI_G00247860 [Acnodon oligacanthus]